VAEKRAVALVSGGLDSLVSLACALQEMEVRLCLFFDYGQPSLEREREAARGIASYYGLPYREVALPWLSSLLPEALRPSGGEGSDLTRLEEVWIPNRNGVFVSVAAAFAEAYRCDYLVVGFNREEAEEFPDNRAEYVARINAALALSTANAVKVKSFVQDLGKAEIVARGMDLSAPLSILWSCYRAGRTMCGRCASCRRLKEALASVPEERRPVIEFES